MNNLNPNEDLEESINQRIVRRLKGSGQNSSVFAILSLFEPVAAYAILVVLFQVARTSDANWTGSAIGVAAVVGLPVFLISTAGCICGVTSIIRKERLWPLGLVGTLGCFYFLIGFL
jgi:hypothetical protein